MGTYTTAELGEMFSVSRATVYRTIRREPPPPNDALRPFAHPPTGTPQTTAPRWVVGFEGFLGALLAALDGGVVTSIHGVVDQRHGLF